MARVHWTIDARQEISSIRSYIALFSPTYAAAIVDRIMRAVTRLESFPLSGRVVPEFEMEAIREVIVDDYRIVYTVQRDEVTILAVSHGSRDFFSQF